MRGELTEMMICIRNNILILIVTVLIACPVFAAGDVVPPSDNSSGLGTDLLKWKHLKSYDVITSSLSVGEYRLSPTDGSNGQVLATDGSGTVSFTTLTTYLSISSGAYIDSNTTRIISLEASTATLETDKLDKTANFVGDVTGTYDATVVGNDSHNHTDTTITLTTGAITSGVFQDDRIADDITLTNITQITNRDHANLTSTGTLTHTEIETSITNIGVSTGTLESTKLDKSSATATYLSQSNAAITYAAIASTKQVNGINVEVGTPTDNYILKYDSGLGKWAYEEDTGGSSASYSYQFYADQLETPVNSDWTVNALAVLNAGSNNAALIVRQFDNTTEEGVGFSLYIPAGVSSMTLTFISRPETAPVAARTVGLKLYERGIPGAVDSWSAGTALTDIDITTDENWLEDTEVDTLTGWGLTAGQIHQFELTRVDPTAGTELTSDWTLLLLIVEFE